MSRRKSRNDSRSDEVLPCGHRPEPGLMKSSSSRSVSLVSKLRDGFGLLAMHLRNGGTKDFSGYDALVAEYDGILSRYRGKHLRDCRVLEIGFGARPLRLFWLFNSGIDVRGVDLDQPLQSLSAASFRAIWKKNGLERAVKSAARHVLFDRREFGAMSAALAQRGLFKAGRLPVDRLIVANAASKEFWDGLGKVDFVYSEDVFEHIPPDDLRQLAARMAEALRPGGLAFIRPMVFTGICGGHQLEWYPHTLRAPRQRRTEPWEHLRQRRDPANTYLNEMRRSDFARLFGEHFRILANTADEPGLGREFLTDEVRRDLGAYDDSELFSNKVLFVLEPL